jgi:hypothetical protein
MEIIGILPLILNLGIRWKRVVRFTLQTLHPKTPLYPFNRRLGVPQRRIGMFYEVNDLLLLLGFELRIVQPVA